MPIYFYYILIIVLLLIGIGCFVSVLILWLFKLYPKRKGFLSQLEKRFGLKYPEKALIIREGKLKGSFRGYEITINPFTGGGNSWILLKCQNPKDFRAIIKFKKTLKVFREPIKLFWARSEFHTGNSEFDKKFRIIASRNFSTAKILPPPIIEKLLLLSRQGEFEIQILKKGVFFTFERELVDLTNFLFDILAQIADNLSKS